MKGAVQQEPAYVVHRRPWRETALLVDLFTLNHGRMSVVAEAPTALRARSRPSFSHSSRY